MLSKSNRIDMTGISSAANGKRGVQMRAALAMRALARAR
jgi:hypothetical protein